MNSLIHIHGSNVSPAANAESPHAHPPNRTCAEKEQALLHRLTELSSVIVALSGGTDSAYLAWAAHRALGHRALAVTAISPSFAAHDRSMVDQFVASCGLRHHYVETREMENPAYRANASDRCYFCKDELFNVLDILASQKNFAAVAYGVNADDTLDFRPGHRAATEHHVVAPLLEAALRKSEIRELSQRAGLPTWDRPASACLASRLPYGTEVTPERLDLVARGEEALRQLGFRQFRVRLHDQLARVEIAPEEMPRALAPEMARAISKHLKNAGFTYVALDLEGYRQGSLNETLPAPASAPVSAPVPAPVPPPAPVPESVPPRTTVAS
jgi:pyridinium-3,5-biscarboxylic acid mononucleotide sulfurtransferase